ncbi:hypothetical protein HRG_014034 [Hirsutella rhossiliensis]
MNEVDVFWHREKPQGMSPDDAPQDPLPIHGKGRPQGSLNLQKKAHVATSRNLRSLRASSELRPQGRRRQQRRQR